MDGLIGFCANPRQLEQLETLAELFERNTRGLGPPRESPSIPRKVHQIWMGDRPIPDEMQRFQEGIQELHPDWEYRLWRDPAECAPEDAELQAIIDGTENYGVLGDLFRALILERHGGIYLDVDVELFGS